MQSLLKPFGTGHEGSTYQVRGWREDSREGVNEYSFSIKAIIGIDCFRVSLVTVQIAYFAQIQTDGCRMHTGM